MSDAFRFYPELFEHRARTMEALSNRGFEWLSHYSSVDPMQEEHGIEVCGIHDKEDAERIQDLLIALFPDWMPG